MAKINIHTDKKLSGNLIINEHANGVANAKLNRMANRSLHKPKTKVETQGQTLVRGQIYP